MIHILRLSYCARRSQRNMQGLVHMALEFRGSTVGIGYCDGDCVSRRASSTILRLCQCTEVCHLCRDIMETTMGESKHLRAWFKHNRLAFFIRWTFFAPKDTNHVCKCL